MTKRPDSAAPRKDGTTERGRSSATFSPARMGSADRLGGAGFQHNVSDLRGALNELRHSVTRSAYVPPRERLGGT